MNEKNTINKSLLSDDELVAMFFEENRQEIEDDGFSHRVMQRLPSRSVRLSRVWTALCLLAGIVFFVMVDGLTLVKHVLFNSLGNISGFILSVDFSGISPITILLTLFTVVVFAAWDSYENYRSQVGI